MLTPKSWISVCLTSYLLWVGSTPAAALNLDLPDLNLPDIGDNTSPSIDMSAERELGIEIFRELRRTRPLIEDPELSDWIRALGNRLARHSGNQGNLLFAIENNAAINAHTLAGGVIIINSGLILNTQSESELAAVMAHEIAHVSQRHIARMVADNKNNALLTGLGVLAGAAAASQSSDASQAILTGAIALQAHQQIAFSHRAEAEADRVGLRILAGAGFNPAAMPHFLEKLERSESSLYGDIGKYLQTHPLSIDRLSDTRSRANQLGNIKPREDPSYLFAREKLRILTGQQAAPLPQATITTKYTKALQAARANNPNAVLQSLGTPDGNQARLIPLALLRAEALNQTKRHPEAEQSLKTLQSLYPGQEAVAQAIATSLAGSNKQEQALAALSRVKLAENTSTEFLETAQRLAQQAGHLAEASFYNAERSIRLGEYAHAKATLEQALNLPDTPPHTLVKMRNRLRETEKMLAQENKPYPG